MARLPVPGSDSGEWGNILNQYLKVSHNDDGTLKPEAVEDTGLIGASATLSDNDPQSLGDAAPGTSDEVSRSDHVHPLPSATEIGATSGLSVGIIVFDPSGVGGSYSNNVWNIGVLNSFATTGSTRFMAVIGSNADDVLGEASNGLFEHIGDGEFERVRTWSLDDKGLSVVAQIELPPEIGAPYIWFGLDNANLAYQVISAGADTSELEAQIDAVEADTTTLETRLNRYYPPNPVAPHLHVSKYVTYDPDFPLDGSATHVGGQLIENTQKITILNNNSGNGGVWELSTSGPAVRGQGFGAMGNLDIGNYDHVSFTGTRWAYFSLFRLLGGPTHMGMAPDPDTGHSGIFAGEGVNKTYRPDLIATTLSGDTITVLNSDGTTVDISISADITGTIICILVLDTLEMVTIDNGTNVMTENFNFADGIWIAMGFGGNGQNAIAATNGHSSYSILSSDPDTRTILDDFEARISALEP